MDTDKIKPIYDKLHRVKTTQTAHLAGVFDSAGSIRLRVKKDSDYTLGYTLRPKLRLGRPTDEDPVLGKLLAYCDENGVKYSIIESNKRDDGTSAIKWVVTDPDSIEQFLEPMMDYLVTNYFRAEMMLDVILPAIRDGKHTNKEDFYELVGLADELRDDQTARKDAKYTQEYFEDKWSITQ